MTEFEFIKYLLSTLYSINLLTKQKKGNDTFMLSFTDNIATESSIM